MALFRSSRLVSRCISKNSVVVRTFKYYTYTYIHKYIGYISFNKRVYFQSLSTTSQPKPEQTYANAEARSVFPGCRAPFTTELAFTESKHYDPIPIYSILSNTGEIDSKENPHLSQEVVTKMYKDMTLLNTMDKIMYESQR